MRLRILVKMVVASVIGVLSAWYIVHDYAKWRALGRDAYLSFHGRTFDTHIAATSSVTGITSGIFAIAIIGAYEGVVALVMKLVSRSPDG
jgi:hypothetical protein